MIVCDETEDGDSYRYFYARDDTSPRDDGVLPVMGQAWLRWDHGQHPSVWAVDTLKEYRRQGVARAVMTTIIDEVRAKGATQIGLACTEGNTPAEALYASLGFVKRGDYFGDHWWSLRLADGGGNTASIAPMAT